MSLVRIEADNDGRAVGAPCHVVRFFVYTWHALGEMILNRSLNFTAVSYLSSLLCDRSAEGITGYVEEERETRRWRER